ncbi:MAG: hypothetical protein OMM_12501, partial [Candidatus Magnetoglobus multicellularis str. Araruama]
MQSVWALSPNQIVISEPSATIAYTDGQCIDIDLMYSVSNGYTALNGLGLLIHYDSDFFSNPSLVYTKSGVIGPYFDDEAVSDDDGDTKTDKTISIAWYDHSTNWPGESLPITLCTLRLTSKNDLSIGDQTILHITSTSTHLGYGFESDPITVTIGDSDQGPVVSQPIADIVVNEDAMPQSIELTPVFTDIDNDDSEIIKSILSNSNPALISAMISNNLLLISFLENQSGNGGITINAISNGKQISDTFTITVNAIDDPPIIANAIHDITSNEDDPSQAIDLSTVFSDIDSSLTHSIESNSNASLISASINQDTLTIEFLANQNGNADITIKAESNGQSISDTFSISVTAVDDPPTLASAIQDISANEDDPSQTID